MGDRTSLRLSRLAYAMLMCLTLVLALPGGVSAVEVPPPTVPTYLQTNGPTSAIGEGDWYTSNANGVAIGYHYLNFTVPCNWPATDPVYIDLFSPEMVVAAVGDEVRPAPEAIGNANNTTFELYDAGTVIGPAPNVPAPGAAGSLGATTYLPLAAGEVWRRFATLAAPVTCGTYVVRSATAVDDQNAWRLRVGWDNDADPNNAPPANYDNRDGLPGTNDEIVVGVQTTTYQHDVATVGVGQCLTLYEYVAPNQTSVRFNNFDMDNGGRVRYYPPSAVYDPLANTGGIVGTISGGSVWNNGGTTTTRSGDLINTPEPGWWRIVTCIPNNNQYIQEGQFGVPAYYSQPPIPDMTVDKDDGVTETIPGGTLTYTINYANVATGATAGAATNVVIADTIPTNTTYVSCAMPLALGTCAFAAGVVTFTFTNAINAGVSGSVSVTVQVNAGASGTVVNNVALDYRDGLGNPYPRETDSDTDQIRTTPVMTVAKDDGVTETTAGATLTYDITYANTATGPTAGPATSVVIRDTIPTNTTYVSCAVVAPATGTCAQAGGVVTFNLTGNVAPGTGGTVRVVVQVNAGATGTVVNNVTLDYNDNLGGPQPQESDSDTDQIRTTPVMTVAKDDGVTQTAPGATLTYNITYANTATGPTAGPATSVVIRDTIPTNTTYVSCAIVAPATGTCAQAGGVVTFNLTGNVAPGTGGTVRVVVQVNAGATGTVVNNVTLDYEDSLGTPQPQESDSDTDQIPTTPVMTVAKDDGVTQTAPGATLTYNITYANTASGANAGPATNVVIRDTIPANTTYVSCAVVAPATGTCAQAGGVVTFNLTGNVAPGTGGTVRVVVQVNAGATGTVVNNVTLDYDDNLGNPQPQESDDDIDQIPRDVQMTIAKDDGVTQTTGGATLTYNITYANTASGANAGSAFSVVIRDTIPTNTTYVSCAPAGICSQAGGVVTFNVGTVAAGANGSVSVTVQVNAGATGTVVNNVTLDYTDNLGNPQPQENDSDTDQIATTPVMTIAKDDGTTQTTAGATLTYDITYANTASGPGAGPATNVVIRDTIPTNTTYVSCAVVAPATGTCAQAGGVVAFNLTGNVVPGTGGTVRVVVQVNAGATGTVVNNVTLDYDDNLGNPQPQESDSDTDTIPGIPVMTVAKDDGVTQANPGDTLTYNITFANTATGPSAGTATSVVLRDTLPANVTYVSCAVNAPFTGSCVLTGAIVTITINQNVAPGQSGSVTLVVTVNTGASGTIVNQVDLDYEDNLGNPRPSERDTDTDQIPSATGMVLSKTDNQTVTAPGATLDYVITFANNATGPTAGPATSVVIRDTIPTNTTYVSCAINAPFTGTCAFAAGVATFTINQNVAPGQTGTVTVRVTVNAGATGSVVNNVTMDFNDDLGNPQTPLTARDTDAIPALPTLAISKSDGRTQAAPGDTLTYSIIVTNTSSLPTGGPATNVVLRDTIPTNTTYVSCAFVAPTTGVCNLTAGVVTFNLNNTLAPGARAAVTLTVRVNANATGSVVNNVTANYEDDLGNPRPPVSARDTDAIVRPDLTITKTSAVATVSQNQVISYTLTYRNVGTSQATGVVLTEQVPINTTFYGPNSSPAWSCANGAPAGTVCTLAIGTVPVGASNSVRFSVQVTSTAPSSGTITNTVRIADDGTRGPDPTPNNNVATATTRLVPPTGITLRYLTATRQGAAVEVRWATSAEIDLWGFRVFRSTEPNRRSAVEVTTSLVPAQGRGGGAEYRLTDSAVRAGVTYYYWLQAIDLDRSTEEYGPVDTRPRPSDGNQRVYLPLVRR